MKKFYPLVRFALILIFCSQAQASINEPNLQEYQMESSTQQLAIALAKQDQKQLQLSSVTFLNQTNLSSATLNQSIQTTEKIFSRIFKTEKNLTPKFIDYLYFEPMETDDVSLFNEMKKNLLVSFLANENAKIYIKQSANSTQFAQLLQEKGAKAEQVFILNLSAKAIFQQIVAQMRQDFPNKTVFPITENRVSVIVPSSEIKPRLALAITIFDQQFKGVEVDDFSYLDQPRENLQHNNETIRYKTFLAMLQGLE